MKYPVAQTTRSYELTYLIPGDKTSAQISSIDNVIKKLVKKHELNIVAEEDWGKLQMAYSIKHAGAVHSEAYYQHLVFEASPASISGFEQELRLVGDVMRYLLVLAESEAGSNIEEIHEDDTFEDHGHGSRNY